jgi:hypothetical protein
VGDARRQKLLCNSYRLEPQCYEQTIEIAGLPDSSKSRISGELQKYWATLDPIPSKRLHKLVDVVKDGAGGVLVNFGDSHVVLSPADLIAKIIPKIPLPTTATAEITESVADYDPETEVIVVCFTYPILLANSTGDRVGWQKSGSKC